MEKELSAKEKIVRINKWQSSVFVHPLTCGYEGCKEINMTPKINDKNEVYLLCPKCNRIQKFIPECCLKLSVEEFEKAEEKINYMFETKGK